MACAQSKKQGLHFVEVPKHNEAASNSEQPKWHRLCSLVPLLVVVLMLNVLPAINVGANGSLTAGGMSIALEALGPQFLEKATQIGLNPECLHRIASIASGGLDTLPHNGAVLTLLAVSNCKHKESIWIFV